MKTDFDLLNSERFRARPAMWLGNKSISSLRIFLTGFWTCQYLNGIENESILPFWLFQPYVQKYYGNKLNNKGYSWNRLILLRCKRNESQAVDKFFDLFDEFQKIKPIGTLSAINLDAETKYFQRQKHIHRTETDDNRNETTTGPAERIYIIEYSNNFGCVLYHKLKNREALTEFCNSVEDAKRAIEDEYGNMVAWVTADANAALLDLYPKPSTN